MRAVLNVCNLKDVPRDFGLASKIKFSTGYHPRYFKKILGVNFNPSLRVRFNNRSYFYFSFKEFSRYHKILKRVLELRAEVIFKHKGISQSELLEKLKKNKEYLELLHSAKMLEENGAPKKFFKSISFGKIVRYEQQTYVRV